MIHCNNCGHINPVNAKHCEACFEALPAMTSCPTCQASVPEDAFFCSQCGASMPRGVAAHSNAPLSSTPNFPPPAPSGLGLAPTDIVSPPFNNDLLPATNVVHPLPPNPLPPNPLPPNPLSPIASELPPTNVVVPSDPTASNLPPTNVINPHLPPPLDLFRSDVPPNNVVYPSSPPISDLPPTHVVHLGEIPTPYGANDLSPISTPLPETIPPRPPSPAPGMNPFDNFANPSAADFDEDSTPTFVVSPGENVDRLSEVETPPQTPVADFPALHFPAADPLENDRFNPNLGPIQEAPDLESGFPNLSEADAPSPPPAIPLWTEEASSPEEPADALSLDNWHFQDAPLNDAPLNDLSSPDVSQEYHASDLQIQDPNLSQPQDPEAQVLEDGAQAPSFPYVAPGLRPGTKMQGNIPQGAQGRSTIIQLPAASLLHIRTNTSITLPKGNKLSIGKPHEAHFPEIDVSGFADSDVVSRKHACFHVTPDGYYLEDVGSSNGTYINDVTVNRGEQVRLKPGDRISLGRENKVTFIFQTG